MATALGKLLIEVRGCTLCSAALPLGPRPVLQASRTARLLIAGQAPGSKVYASGVPFDDASGERLRRNAWFEADVVPRLQERVAALLGCGRAAGRPP